MKKSTALFLALIFIASLSLRLYLAFQTQYLTGEGYYAVRQIEAIKETGKPLYQDPLSYGGSENVFSPGFYYILTAFSFFMKNEEIIKIVPSIFASLTILFVFLIAREIVKDEKGPLAAAALSAFIPIFFESTLNNASPYTLIIPLLLFAMYSFMKADDRRYASSFIAASIALPLIHSSAIILLITLVIYLALIKMEGFSISKEEVKLTIFSFVSLIILAILFFKAIMLHGWHILSANVPSQISSNFFAQTSILEALYKIGLLTVFYGTYSISKNIDSLNKQNTLILSFISAAAILLWAKMVELNAGLSLLGIGLSIIIATNYQKFISYIQKVRLQAYRVALIISAVFAFLITAFGPSYLTINEISKDVPTISDVSVLAWLKDKAPEGSVVAAAVDDGHFITGFSGKKDIIDRSFLLKDSQKRYDEISMLFEATEEAKALDVLKKYDVDYVFISRNVLKNYDLKKPEFYWDEACFKPIIRGESSLYQVTCLG